MEGNIGEIRMFAGTFAPRNWAFCQGQLLAIQTNTALFSILGTTYGGNGQTTFGLPDLRGRVPVGQGTGPGLSNIQLGQMAGVENTTILNTNMPQHTHGLNNVKIAVNGATGDTTSPVGSFIAGKAGGYAESFAPNQFLGQGSISGTTDIAGGSQPIGIRNPYLGMNYVICMFGIFPSRN
jgi:microcystin-dependent protein